MIPTDIAEWGSASGIQGMIDRGGGDGSVGSTGWAIGTTMSGKVGSGGGFEDSGAGAAWSTSNADSWNTSGLAASTTVNSDSIRFRTDTGNEGTYRFPHIQWRVGHGHIGDYSSMFRDSNFIDITNKDIVVEFSHADNNVWARFTELVVYFDSSTADFQVNWPRGGADPYTRTYIITKGELLAAGFQPGDGYDSGGFRITIPENSMSHNPSGFNPLQVHQCGIGIEYAAGDASYAGDGIQVQIFEFSLTEQSSSSWSNADYIFHHTVLTDEANKSERIESLPSQYLYGSTKVFNTDTTTAAGLTFTVTRAQSSFINGRIYWQLADKLGDGIGEKFLLCEVDKDGDSATPGGTSETGILPASSVYWRSWQETGTSTGIYAASFIMPSRPESSTFQLESGYPDDTKYLNAFWKTAAVVGRQVYIGNVQQPATNISSGTYDGSKILKTAVGKYYGFPDSQYVDLEFGGDVINVIRSVGDRLFVFSTDKLTIINVAQDFEVLEGQFENMGITYHKQVCKVSEGLAWVNAQGVHYFNGTKVETLSDEKMLSESWTSKSIIGYFPARKMLLVWVDINSDGTCTKIHCYSFKSNSWAGTLTTGTILSNQPETNVVTGNNGITYYIAEDDAIKKIVEDANGTPTITLQTGRIGMGDLSRNKKFTKIYVVGTSLGGNEELLYGVDGGAVTNTLGDLSSGENAITLSGVSGKDIQLKITGASTYASEINDIKIIYREKTLK